MDPGDFHRLDSRRVGENDPASRRTAVSRPCYALFHVGHELVESCGYVIPQNDKGHKLVQEYLFHSRDIEVKDIARNLDEFRAHRNRAD